MINVETVNVFNTLEELLVMANIEQLRSEFDGLRGELETLKTELSSKDAAKQAELDALKAELASKDIPDSMIDEIRAMKEEIKGIVPDAPAVEAPIEAPIAEVAAPAVEATIEAPVAEVAVEAPIESTVQVPATEPTVELSTAPSEAVSEVPTEVAPALAS